MLAQVDSWVWMGGGDLYGGLKEAAAGIAASIVIAAVVTWMLFRTDRKR